MSSLYLVLCSLILLSYLTFAQVILPANPTLLEAAQRNSAQDPNLTKAYLSILQTHPELQSFYILNVSSEAVNTTGTDYYITLKGADNSTIMVVVSLEINLSSFVVSYVKLDSAVPQSTKYSPSTSAQQSIPPNTNNIQQQQAILTPVKPNLQANPDKTPSSKLPGGFQLLSNLNDPKFVMAVGYLQQLHANLINYQLVSAQYQVVAGIFYLVYYNGLDQFTRISAKLYVGLNGLPSEVQFNVSCLPTTKRECTGQIANQIYYGNEFVINSHPELRSYRISSIYIEQNKNQDLTYISTFQNTKMELRAIAEVIVGTKGAKLLSFYSYKYQ